MKELIEVYERYILLLVEELNEIATFAVSHDWRSSRVIV